MSDTVFRPMRRFKQALSAEESIEILKTGYRGFLSVIGDGGYPYAIPINFVYDEGKLFFHSAREGHKLDAHERIQRLRQLGSKYFPEQYDLEGDLQRNGPRAEVLEFQIEHLSGKRVKEN